MTVPAQQPLFNAAVANGVTTLFPYTFLVLDAEDLAVTLDGAAFTGSFTLTGIGQPGGGNVIFHTPPASGVSVVLSLNPVLRRETDYRPFGDWAAGPVNADFDRLWLALQALGARFARAIKLPVATATDQTLAGDAATRANKLVGFDGDGNATLMQPADLSLQTVSGFIATLLDDADAPAARATLGAGTGDVLRADVQRQTLTAFTTAGAPPAFTLTTSPGYGAPAVGQRLRVKFHADGVEGSTNTLNRDGIGAWGLMQYASTGSKVSAAVAANQLADLEFDGSDWVLLNPLPPPVTAQTGVIAVYHVMDTVDRYISGWGSTPQDWPAMSITLTPRSAASKFFMIFEPFCEMGAPQRFRVRLLRNGVRVTAQENTGNPGYGVGFANFEYAPDNDSTASSAPRTVWDAPNTAAPITYHIQGVSPSGAQDVAINRMIGNYGSGVTRFTIMEYV